MAGALDHSPADVTRWLLVALGAATDPEAGGAWPAFAAAEPALPDECVTVYDAAGTSSGYSEPDSERHEMHGVQLRVRSKDHPRGWAKARALAVALDAAGPEVVAVGDGSYCVGGYLRTSEVVPLGKAADSRRFLFTVNATVDLRQVA